MLKRRTIRNTTYCSEILPRSFADFCLSMEQAIEEMLESALNGSAFGSKRGSKRMSMHAKWEMAMAYRNVGTAAAQLG
jgi:hypothetical protein